MVAVAKQKTHEEYKAERAIRAPKFVKVLAKLMTEAAEIANVEVVETPNRGWTIWYDDVEIDERRNHGSANLSVNIDLQSGLHPTLFNDSSAQSAAHEIFDRVLEMKTDVFDLIANS